MIQKIDHIGIAVNSIVKAIPFFESSLGLTCEGCEEVPSQKVKIALFSVGEVHIELLEPTADDSPIAKFIEKNGEGIHHIAFNTDELPKQLERARNAGTRLIHETPVEGAYGKEIAFLHPKSTLGVLIELCSAK